MPVTVSYPGVYLEEVAVQTPTVVAATTSNAAVIDYFVMGPVNTAVAVTSLNQFNSTFGGVNEASEGSYAVQQFFLNGGSFVWVVRVVPTGATPTGGGTAGTAASVAWASLPPPSPPTPSSSSPWYVTSANPGAWGNAIGVTITQQPAPSPPPSPLPPAAFTVQVVLQPTTANAPPTVLETYYNASLSPTASNFLGNLVNGVSQYIFVTQSPTYPPATSPLVVAPIIAPNGNPSYLVGGSNGSWATDGSDFWAALMAQVGGEQTVYTNPTPVPALNQIAPQVFNILMLPAEAILPTNSSAQALVDAAIEYCQNAEAFFILDPPPPSGILANPVQVQAYPWQLSGVNTVNSSNDLVSWAQQWGYVNANNYSAATYYPWLLIADANNTAQARYVGPSGTMAGVYATNDLSYGVWNAPAGTNAVLQGASLAAILTDTDSGTMNPDGLNALRSFPIYGNISWGARTLAGANQLQSTFKYINVRRLTDFIEQSLYQSLKWAVFQPNAAPLWASITQEVTAFMSGLFSQGAFQGTSASQAYFVQCGPSTTTQQDILNGIVNVVVGFAPVLPAEFVILQIQVQLTPFSASS